jgi:uncharacterized protein
LLKFPTISRVLPFATFIALIVLSSIIERFAPELYESVRYLLYPIRVFLTLAVLVWFWVVIEKFRPSLGGMNATSILLSMGVGIAVIALWIVIGPLLRIGTPSQLNPIPQDPMLGMLWLITRFIGAVIVVPVIEELFWRSYLTRRIDSVDVDSLKPKDMSWTAIFATSVVFGLEHQEVLAGVIAGIAFCWLYRRCGDLREAVLAHATANAILFFYVLYYSAFEFWG